MNSNPASLKSILAIAALASPPLFALDPLMDEPESFAEWRISKELSYVASSTPTWEAASWVGGSKEIEFGENALNLDGSMGFLADDFQLDSAWNLEPKGSATWSMGRLSIEGWGWGLWNDLGWTDEGAGSDLSLLLTDPDKSVAQWKSGVHGWISRNSGSAMGLSLSRTTHRNAWSTSLALTARRLWDVDAAVQRPGSMRRTTTTNTADQWQALFQSGLDRNWSSVSVGIGLDIDLRASDVGEMSTQSPMGKGRMSNSSTGYQYTATADPSANVSWTPGSWSFTVTTGWSTDVRQAKGSFQPSASFWTSTVASKSW